MNDLFKLGRLIVAADGAVLLELLRRVVERWFEEAREEDGVLDFG